MNLVSGNTLWNNKTDIPYKYPYISKDINCDVLVIGAGITGAICSYYFSMDGIDTVLVEKNIIGYESTRASTSILQYEIDNNLVGLKGDIGLTDAIKCFKMTQNAVYDIEKMVNNLDDKCDFNLRGCLYYSDKENDVNMLKNEYKLREENGFDVDYLNNKTALEKFPFPIKAGIYSKSGAGEIDPYKFTHQLIKKSVENKLKVFENSEIIELINEKDSVSLITNNHFKIKAKKVIIATGYNGRNYLKNKTAILTRTFTIVTKPVNNLNFWYNRCIIRDTNQSYTYLRTTNDNRIIIGGEDVKIGGQQSKIANLTNSDSLSQQKYELLLNKLKKLFPEVSNTEVEYKFSGYFGETKDGLPYIGECVDYPNCYFCLGYGSNGILYSNIGAKLLKELYRGNYCNELNLFRLDR